MNKLEVGMYVRTIKGIAKIKKIDKCYNEFIIETDNCITIDDTGFTEEEMIKRYKSSHNIIDLIEFGDYVNGRFVDKYNEKLGNFVELPNGKWEFIELLNESYYISSIVTKEQFESMEYKVGDSNE